MREKQILGPTSLGTPLVTYVLMMLHTKQKPLQSDPFDYTLRRNCTN